MEGNVEHRLQILRNMLVTRSDCLPNKLLPNLPNVLKQLARQTNKGLNSQLHVLDIDVAQCFRLISFCAKST